MAESDTEVAKAWARHADWLHRHRPDLAAGLRDGTDEEGLEWLADHNVPSDWQQLWAIHDGEGTLLLDGWWFLPVLDGDESVRSAHARMAHVSGAGVRSDAVHCQGPVQPFVGHPAWIPIASDISGRLLCIDLAPADAGQVGQVIVLDEDVRRVLFDGVVSFLHACHRRAEEGQHPDDDLESSDWDEEDAVLGESLDIRPAPPTDNTPLPEIVPSPPAKSVAEPTVLAVAQRVDASLSQVDVMLSETLRAEGGTVFVRDITGQVVGFRVPAGAWPGAELRLASLGGDGTDLRVRVVAEAAH